MGRLQQCGAGRPISPLSHVGGGVFWCRCSGTLKARLGPGQDTGQQGDALQIPFALVTVSQAIRILTPSGPVDRDAEGGYRCRTSQLMGPREGDLNDGDDGWSHVCVTAPGGDWAPEML